MPSNPATRYTFPEHNDSESCSTWRDKSSVPSSSVSNSGRVFSGTTATAKARGTFGSRSQQTDNATSEHYSPERLVLIINYSHSALTAALAIADCAYEYRRVLFSPELDADANLDAFDRPPTKDVKQQLQQIMSSGRDEEGDIFVGSLRRLTALPVECVKTKEHTRVDYVVLSGDAVEDTQFLTLLEEVLGDRYGDLMLDTGVATSPDVNPLYSAAGYAAFFR